MKFDDVKKEINRFIDILDYKFIDTYPDTFLKCTTKDKWEHENSNPCMYSWYMKIVNSVSNLNFSPKYDQTEIEVISSDWNCVKRFVDDFEKAENWQSFIFENIKIK